MSTTIVLISSAFVAYFLESIFGFGGTIIFLGIAGFNIDFKLALEVAMFAGMFSGLAVLIQSYKKINLWHVKKIILLTLPGVIIGTFLIDILQIDLLLKLFSFLLIVYGLLTLLIPKLKLPKWVDKMFVILGGFIQGIFTIGGPFVLMGYKNNFSGKQELRATMAGFFFFINFYRLLQNYFTGGTVIVTFFEYYWLGFFIMIAVWIGYFFHVKIPEKVFYLSMVFGLTTIGFVLLLR
jgi:hypothetical protein